MEGVTYGKKRPWQWPGITLQQEKRVGSYMLSHWYLTQIYRAREALTQLSRTEEGAVNIDYGSTSADVVVNGA